MTLERQDKLNKELTCIIGGHEAYQLDLSSRSIKHLDTIIYSIPFHMGPLTHSNNLDRLFKTYMKYEEWTI